METPKLDQLYIDQLFEKSPYQHDAQVDELFLNALQEELVFHYENNAFYKQFCERKQFNPYQKIQDIASIPPVSVSVFKELGFELNSVSKEDVKFALQSSATSGIPSTIVVDKITAKRQAKAMVKVIQDFIGRESKPFLIMDVDPNSAHKKLLGARYAAVSGYLKFANKIGYFLKADQNDRSYFDVESINEFVTNLDPEKPVVVFGFTYILFSEVLKSVEQSGLTFKLPAGSKVIHIGGWKKLESEKIDKKTFNEKTARCFGVEEVDVIDIYGFTEQMGLNYPDCPCGCKHTPAYSKLIVRDVVTQQALPAGQEGMLEFITPIPHSYPGNAVLTDDIGVILDEPCPYQRAGTRFQILGRLKKAEVRGCGDVLSNKLTFQTSTTSHYVPQKEDLKPLLFSSYLSATNTSEQNLQFIISELKSHAEWLKKQPIDALIGLIGAAATKWGAANELFLSTWCQPKHLESVVEFGLRGNKQYIDQFLPFYNSEKHFLKANPRGLTCHWLAGNVQILGMFALVQSILTKNVNLLKVSARDNGVFVSLLNVFKGLEYTTETNYIIKGDDLLKTIALIYFPREAANLGKIMSMEADCRIAWGGRESVETVSTYPAKFDGETVIFGPKLSFSVINREALSSEQEVKKLTRKMAVDVFVFDQTGCASPHNLYIEKGGNISPKAFCEALSLAMNNVEAQMPITTLTPEQVSAVHSIRGVYDFKGMVYGSDSMSWTILYDDRNELKKPVYSRVLFVHEVESINDALIHIDDSIQTIGLACPDIEKAKAFAIEATNRGVSRCPLIGRMLNFEMPWDGIVLIDRLVKWNTLGGPLC